MPPGWAVLAVAALALAVAAAIQRPAADFADRPILAVLRDGSERPVWEIRLASRAHEIAVKTLRAQPAPAGRAFELWLYADRTPRPLGILPEAGRTVIPLAPRDAARLAGSGALWATREPREGAPDLRPSGPPAFRGRFPRVVN